MFQRRTLLILICLLSFHLVWSQSTGGKRPASMWEVGLHGGYFFLSGDVQSKPGYGAGLHVRKSLDYMFSIRAEGLYAIAEGATSDDRTYSSNMYSGSGFLVISLNGFRFDQSVRKMNLYALIGGGGNFYETIFTNEELVSRMDSTIERAFSPQATAGLGLAYRISKRFNIGVEWQTSTLFGRRADLMDGSEKEVGVRTPFRDLMHYGNLRINYNLGNSSKQSEPLYWLNPLDVVLNDLQDVKKKQEEGLQDSDGDGVIDAVDQEPDTPSNAPVDTKGRLLDSDKDGIADYRDKEPFYPPRAGERVNADGVVENPIGGGGVTEDRVKELIKEALMEYQSGGGAAGGAGGAGGTGRSGPITEWFLPMIHFGTDSYSIKYSDYGTLASMARMLKGNPNMKLVVIGHTDQTGSEEYNEYLSYQRSKGIVDHLVNNHGIGRGRLILNWKGKTDALVPSSSSYMNRRVEFRVATSQDVEMDPPANTGQKKTGGY